MTSIIVLASAARTATTVSETLSVGSGIKGIHLIVDVTVDPAAASLTPKIDAYDAASGKWYNLITGAAIAAVGTTVLRVGSGLLASANAVVRDVVPELLRVTVTAADTDSMTYSVGLNVIK